MDNDKKMDNISGFVLLVQVIKKKDKLLSVRLIKLAPTAVVQGGGNRIMG